jgi:hypothetical protein
MNPNEIDRRTLIVRSLKRESDMEPENGSPFFNRCRLTRIAPVVNDGCNSGRAIEERRVDSTPEGGSSDGSAPGAEHLSGQGSGSERSNGKE